MDFSSNLNVPAWGLGSRVVLFFGLIAVAFSVYRRRHAWRKLSSAARRGFWLLLVLSVLTNITPFLSFPVENSLIPIGPDWTIEITLLSHAPIALAAGWWGGGFAVVLALAGGLANALRQGSHLFILLEWAMVAGVISFLLRQDYTGGLPALLRRPLPATLAAAILVWPLQLASLILDQGPSGLAQLPMIIARWSFDRAIPLFVSLLVAGALGELAQRIAPTRWFRVIPLRLPPYAANLNRQLLFALLPMAVVGIAVLFSAVFLNARRAAIRLVVDQMERDAARAAEIIPFFIRTEERLALNLPSSVNLLQGVVGSGTGFITDEQDQIFYHPDAAEVGRMWRPATDVEELPTTSPNSRAYQERSVDGTAQLVYRLSVEGHPWNVVIEVPVSMVMKQATEISFPHVRLLVAVGALGIVFLLMISRRLTRPLGALAAATEQIIAGRLGEPVLISGADEVGRLGEAFERMRVRVRSQVDELSLLLQASLSVASSLNLDESLPPILQGAMTVTDAKGARLLLLPFDGRHDKLQTYSAGLGAADMSVLDADVLQLVTAEGGMIAIENVARARTVLDVGAGPDALQAVIALPLRHEANLLGALWLGYSAPHHFSREETDLLTTLVGQAAVAVANARLFEASEGGRQQLAAILTATPDAVIVTDSRLRLLLLNPAAEDLFGLQGHKITGRRINEIIHQPQLAVALRASDERASAYEIKLPDGRTFSASTSSILRQDGSIIGRLAVLRDVTYFKQLDRQKTDAIAAVSHDLKNPLSLMHGYATMLPMVGKLNARQREFSEKIVAGVEQMSTLIEDVLDLHRIESAPGADWESCHLDVLLQQVVEEMRPAAVTKGIQLVGETAVGIKPVAGDESLLRRAIRHLLDNGVRYTPVGGSVVARVEMHEEEVVLAVADSGVGISRADRDRLFERFYRVRDQEQGESGGSGLGLAFAKSISERHGGRVWFDSKLGQGSTFFISLPSQKGDGDEV